jgi:hypothetical protein
MWVDFHPCARYSYKSFIRPSHRGRHIGRELHRRANEICPRRGRTLDLLMVNIDNAPSLRALYAAGCVAVGYAGFLRCLSRTFAFRSPGARRYGFALRN